MVGKARLELALACLRDRGAIRYSTSRWLGWSDSNRRLPTSKAGGQSATLHPNRILGWLTGFEPARQRFTASVLAICIQPPLIRPQQHDLKPASPGSRSTTADGLRACRASPLDHVVLVVGMVGAEGIGPSTPAVSRQCSTDELRAGMVDQLRFELRIAGCKPDVMPFHYRSIPHFAWPLTVT